MANLITSHDRLARADLLNPFARATVFLSHSWTQNYIADKFFEVMTKEFRTWYDRRTLMELGQPIVRRREILASDFFLFLGSRESFRQDSSAFRELLIADNGRPGKTGRIGIVALNDFEVPEVFRDCYFEHCHEATSSSDIKRIIGSVKKRLEILGGLSKTVHGYVAGGNPEPVVESLLNRDPSAPNYAIATIFSAKSTKAILNATNDLSASDQKKLVENLLLIYLSEDHQTTRQNAVYLLSRIAPGEESLLPDLKRNYPLLDEPFLYRGFHVALGFLGDTETMNQYAWQLLTLENTAWNAQRTFNNAFHDVYYGSREGALSILRHEIRTLDWKIHLPLDVATLALMSKASSDIELVESLKENLLSAGVEKRILTRAASIINRRRKQPL